MKNCFSINISEKYTFRASEMMLLTDQIPIYSKQKIIIPSDSKIIFGYNTEIDKDKINNIIISDCNLSGYFSGDIEYRMLWDIDHKNIYTKIAKELDIDRTFLWNCTNISSDNMFVSNGEIVIII